MTETISRQQMIERIDTAVHTLKDLRAPMEGRRFPVLLDGEVRNEVLCDLVGPVVCSHEQRIAVNAGVLVQRKRSVTTHMYEPLNFDDCHDQALWLLTFILEHMVTEVQTNLASSQ